MQLERCHQAGRCGERRIIQGIDISSIRRGGSLALRLQTWNGLVSASNFKIRLRPDRPQASTSRFAPSQIQIPSLARILLCGFRYSSFMATRRMDALFPKRKSSVSSVKGSKALSAASYKIKDLVYSAHDDIGSGAGTLGAADSQPAALVSSGRKDLHEECDDVEEILRQFDMNMAYGPCLGISRLERFERACRLNLKPPMDVKNLLMRAGGNPNALWEGRV